jgi:2-phosphosulfolactate phosphatase
MGLEATTPIEEDTLCAEYLKCLLENKPIDIQKEIELLKSTSGSKFFDKNQQDVFPEKDFYMCTDINKFDFILKLENDAYIKKYPVSITD